LGSNGSGQDSVAGCCEQGNEPSGYTKVGYQRDYELVKDSAKCSKVEEASRKFCGRNSPRDRRKHKITLSGS